MKKVSLPVVTSFGVVREMRKSDCQQLISMVGKLAAHHNDTPQLTAENVSRDIFGEKPWIYLLVAETDGKLIGYTALSGLIRLQFGMRGLDMHHLFTEESFRGRGVGSSLVEACKLKALELSCRFLTVGTSADNLKAQEFYVALGFNRRNDTPPRFEMSLEK
jgi:GNAT superfamily N-acetyltransferase